MTVRAKLKNIKNGIQVGDSVPHPESYGNNGHYFEDVLSRNGHNLSAHKGIDLPEIGAELKTRMNGSSSYQTVGAINGEDIINLPYEDTHLYDKLQSQYRIKYDNDLLIVTSASVYDFSDPDIQSKVKEAYDICRQKFINGDRSDWIAGSAFGNLEKQSTNSWQFRISPKAMKTMEAMAKSQFKNMFS
jgi:hypothetical protein